MNTKSWSTTWWGTVLQIALILGICFALLVAYAVLEQLEAGKRLFFERSRAQLPSISSAAAPEIPIATTDDPSLGDPKASVVIVEFSDFQCPFCRKAYPEIKRLLGEYADSVHLIYRDFPVTYTHPDAFNAALAGECAQEAGKFWEYHDYLFDHQNDLSVDALKRYAGAVGMPADTFAQCLDSQKYKNEVANDFEDGKRLGITGTPTFFINNSKVPGVIPYDILKKIVDQLLGAQNLK